MKRHRALKKLSYQLPFRPEPRYFRGQQAAWSKARSEPLVRLRERWSVAHADSVLLFDGRLQSRKRLERLVNLVSGLQISGQKAHALLVVDGEERARLGALAAQLHVSDSIRFLDAIDEELQLAECFCVSDLCLIPSGPGLRGTHAMSCVVPVLATNDANDQYPEAGAIEDSAKGDLCPMQDWHATLCKTQEVLHDLAVRPDIESRYRETIAARFTPEDQAKSLLQATRTVLELDA